MTDTRKVQLGAEFDASGVRKGTQEAKDAARDMARNVQASGQQAAKGLEGMGKGSADAAQKIERDTRSIAASIQRATAAAQAGEKGTAAYFEQLAKARGANLATLQPYIDQLRQAERAQQAASASLGAMGVSAGQTRAALRQLPAQFTDIFTSLSSGQAPLTVLIQQGGQIKDSFGGIGAALRGVAGAISPLALGLGALAGGAVAVALAYKQATGETDEYRRALVLTGNAVGTTTAALADAAARVSQGVGTQSQAAAVLAQLAGTGRVAAADLELVTEAAIRLEREGGPAVKDTVAAFAELGKAPTAGALKLNESTRFLTVEILEQIRSLEEQGRTFEAARVAQQAYAREAIDRANELKDALGPLEKAWRSVGEQAAKAWDEFKGNFRGQTPAGRLAEIQQQLGLLDQARQDRFVLFGPSRQDLNAERGAINRSLLNQSEQSAAQRQAALAVEDAEKARKAWQQWGDAAETAGEKAASAIAKMRAAMKAENEERARQGKPLITEAEAKRAEDEIRRRAGLLKEDAAAQRAAAEEARKQQAVLNDLLGITDDYVESLRRLQVMRQRGVLTEEQYLAAVNKVVQRQPAVVAAERERARAMAEMERTQQRYLQGLDRELDASQRQAQALEDEFVELTQGKDARERIVQQRLDDAAAMARQVAAGALWTEGLTVEAQKLIELADAQQAVADKRRRNTEQRTANDAADQARKAVDEARRESERWMADLQSGLTDVFRQAFLAGGSFGKNFARGLAAEVQARLATALATVLAEAVLGLGVRAAGAVVGAAGGGGGAGSWLQGASTAQSAYNLYNGGGLYGQAGRMALNTSLGSSIWYGSGAGLAQGGGAAAGIGGSSAGAILGDGSGAVAASASGSGSLGASASWGTWAAWAALIYAGVVKANSDYNEGFRRDQARDVSQEIPLGRLLGDVALFGGIEASKANFLSQLGFSDRFADLFSGSTAIAKTFGRAAPRITGQGVSGTISGGDFSGQSFFDVLEKGGIFRSDKRYTQFAELPDELGRLLDQGARQVFDQAGKFGDALGLPAERLSQVTSDLRIEFARPENDTKEAIAEATRKNLESIAEALGEYGDDLVDAWAAAVAPVAQYGESAAQTIQRVGTAILQVNDVLDTLGLTALQASVDGGKAALALQELFGGVDTLRTAAGGYLQNFYSDAERTTLALQGIGQVLADVGLQTPATRDAFRQLVEAQDLTTQAGREAFATLLGVADAFAAVVEPARAAADILAERQRLERELLALQGDTAAIRALERAELDASTRALYDQIKALQDQQDAAKLAADAAEEAAEAAKRAAQAEAERVSTLNRLSRSIDTALLSGVEQAWTRVLSVAEAERRQLESTAQSQLDALEQQARQIESQTASTVNTLGDVLRQLRGEVAADGGRGAALATLRQAVANGRTGAVVDLETVRAAAAAAGRVDTGGFATALDYRRELSRTATLLQDAQSVARQQQSRELAAIAAQQVQIEQTLQEQLDVIDAQLNEARAATERLIAIDGGVQTVAQAIAALSRSIGAAMAARGSPSADVPVGQWVTSGGAQVWQAAGGAVAMRQAGAEIGDTLIRDITGASYTIPDAQATVRDYLARDDITGLYAQAVARGYDSNALDALMGWAPGTSLAEALRRKLPAFATGTPYVPQTGPAIVHAGERILTAADNAELMRIMRGRDDGALVAELRALRDAVERQAATHGSKLDAIAVSSRRTADDVETLAIFGLPAEVAP